MQKAVFFSGFSLIAGIGVFCVWSWTRARAPSRALQAPVFSEARISGTDLAGAVADNKRAPVSIANLPLRFEANDGQTDSRVKFMARGAGYTLFVTPDESVLTLLGPLGPSGPRVPVRRASTALPVNSKFGTLLARPEIRSSKRIVKAEGLAASVLGLRLLNANVTSKVVGMGELRSKSNFFLGNDRRKWRTDVANYAKVHYPNIYPGVDLIYYGNQAKLEHDFVVAPGADPSRIQLLVEGAEALDLNAEGDLIAHLTTGKVVLRRPVIYQPKNHQGVDGHFSLIATNRIGFEIGSYDARQPLIIDPVLEYSTYLSGSATDAVEALVVDPAGDAYVSGFTTSSDFPTTSAAYRPSAGAGEEVFLAKLNPSGSELIYSTYLGGSANEDVGGIAVNAAGEAYVVGYTSSADFPTTPGAFQTALSGESDAFVTKLNATGSALLYSTYLGGSDKESFAYMSPFGIALDTAGNAYVAGSTVSMDFPTTAGAFQRQLAGNADAFVTKLNPTGTGLVYSTYLGGSGTENAWLMHRSNIAVDASGNAVVSGGTSSVDFPTTPGALDTTCGAGAGCSGGNDDVFVSKLNPTGSELLFSTYLGGNGPENLWGMAQDASGNIYLAGGTASADFPITPGAFLGSCGGCTNNASDGFIAKLNAAGSTLLYSTYLGGSGNDHANAISVDAQASAYVAGTTASTDFPLVNPLQSTLGGNTDAFIAKLNATGSAVLFSTYLGGADSDVPSGIGLDSAGHIYTAGALQVAGMFASFPTTPGALQEHEAGGMYEGFLAKLDTQTTGPSLTLPSTLNFGDQLMGTGTTQSVHLTNIGDATLSISSRSTSGEFQIYLNPNTSCGSFLDPGKSCDIALRFTPEDEGAHEGTLTITSNAAGSPHNVKLLGNSTNYNLAISPNSQTVKAGETATYTLNVNPVAGFQEEVSIACAGSPQAASCKASPNLVAPANGNPGKVSLTVTTTARSLAPPVQQPLPTNWVRFTVPWLACFTLLLFAGAALRRKREYLILAGALLCVTLWAACGGGSTTSAPQIGTPAGTYTLTLTGSFGNVSRNTTAILTVN